MPTFSDVLQARLSRRSLLTGGLSAAGLGWLGPAAWASRPLGFTGVPVSTADTLVVPPGYVAEILYAWGDPISDGPAFKPDASNSVDDQLRQAGMHHDGMRFFPLPAGQTGSTHGLLAINHEYTDDGLLHPDGMLTWTAEKVRKSQAAHGMSVIEVRTGRQPLERGPAVALRAPGHRGDADGDHRAGRRTRVDADRRRSGRPHRARHDEQLRDGLHPVGHLSHLRGELPVLLRQPLRPTCPRSSSATASPRGAAATAGTSSTSASMPRAIRTSPIASAGSSRSIPSTRRGRP